MDGVIRPPELLGWAILGLVLIQITRWAYGALGKKTIGHAELQDGAYCFEGWVIFFGLLLMAAFWLLLFHLRPKLARKQLRFFPFSWGFA
jgi:hypothetical protein